MFTGETLKTRTIQGRTDLSRMGVDDIGPLMSISTLSRQKKKEQLEGPPPSPSPTEMDRDLKNAIAFL